MLITIQMKLLIAMALLLLGAFIIINCFTNKSSFETEMTPSEVVIAAYLNTNDDKYLKFENYLSADSLHDINRAVELVSGVKDVWNIKTRNGKLDGIEIINEDMQGDKVTIAIRRYFNDGYIDTQHECLIKEAGQWKLAW